MWVAPGLKPATEPFVPILVGTSLEEGREAMLRTVELWSPARVLACSSDSGH